MSESPTDVHGRIFISYRREDAAYPAGWLFDRLAERFGNEQIFKDVDSIELGDDFVEVIGEAVGSTDVLLALIGDRWLTVVDEDGDRRLEDPEDFVRLEIEAALTRKVRVIPILVEGAKMPRENQLPPSLSPLARRQALELSPSRFAADTGKLLAVLEKTLAEATAPGKGGSAGPAIETPEPSERKRPPPTDPKVPPEPPETPVRRPGLTDRRRLLLAIAGAALLVALLVGGVVLLSGGDDSAQETTGPESPPAQDDDGSSDAAVNGRIAFVSDEEIWDALPDGSGLRQLTRGFAAVRRPEWSPDGTKVAFASNRGNSANDYDLWILDTADESTTRLTMGPAEDGSPTWSPDGTEIAFGRQELGSDVKDIWIIGVESGELRQVTDDPEDDDAPDWSSTDRIAFESKRNGGYEIYTLDPAGLESEVRQVTFNTWADFSPDWSPDGSRIAYRTIQRRGVGHLHHRCARARAAEAPHLHERGRPQTLLVARRQAHRLRFADRRRDPDLRRAQGRGRAAAAALRCRQPGLSGLGNRAVVRRRAGRPRAQRGRRRRAVLVRPSRAARAPRRRWR